MMLRTAFPFRRMAVAFLGIGFWIAAAANPSLAQEFETPARQLIMVDYDTGAVLFSKNPDQPMPPSSMSKMMTAHMVFERLAAGTLKLEDKFTVSQNAWRKGGAASGGSTMFLNLGDEVTVADLLRGVIIQSGNDACIVLAEGLAGTEERFSEQMTKRAHELGLKNSVFRNASGLPDPAHVTTARDLALLAKLTISHFPQFYAMYAEKEFRYNNIKQGNRNPLLYRNMGADGLKTGHTEAAGYGLTASVKRGDRRLILVVNGLRSMNERARETERLIEIGFRDFDNYRLFTAGTEVDQADVWLGDAPRVPLVVTQNVVETLQRNKQASLKARIVYDGPVPAPIKKGDPVGKLVISAGDQTREVPLAAGADVGRLGAFARIGAAMGYLVWGAGKR